jgi:hypothetical protein
MSHRYGNLFEDGNFDIRRKRILDDIRSESADRINLVDREKFRQDYINRIYSTYKDASDKATVLIDYAAEVAKKYTIPVPVEAVEVRQSVSRQDPDVPDGSIITFDLFVRMIDIVESQAKRVNLSIIDNRYRDALSKERIVRKAIDKRFDDDDSLWFLLLFGAHLMTLYVIHKIGGIWRSEETSEEAIGSTDPGNAASHQATGIKQMVEGFAASLVIQLFDEVFARLIASEGRPDIDTRISSRVIGSLASAKETAVSPLMDKIKKSMSLDDHETILKYSIKYISTTNDRGYEFWYAYFIGRRSKYTSRRMLSYSPLFSKRRYAEYNFGWTQESEGIDPDDIALADPEFPNRVFGFFEQLGIGLINEMRSSVVNYADDYSLLLDHESTELDRGLDNIARVLESRFSRDAICCFVLFFGKIDTDILKSIRFILSHNVNIQIVDLDLTLSNMQHRLVSWVKDAILRELLALVQMIFDKIVGKLFKFLSDITVEAEFLVQCPLIHDLLQAIMDSIFMIARDLEEMIKNYSTSIMYDSLSGLALEDKDIDNVGLKSSLKRLHKKRRLRSIIRILDAIISSLESGAVFCSKEEVDPNNPNHVAIEDIVDSPIIGDIDDYLNIPDNVASTYFNDIKEFTFNDGTKLPSVKYREITIDNNVSGDDKINKCRDMFRDIFTTNAAGE